MNIYLYNFLKKLFVFGSALISLFSLVIITLGIIILASKSITIKDENKYISKLLSWYFSHEVYFQEVKINNISLMDNYEIIIKNLIIEEVNNYKNIEIENIEFNISVYNLIKGVNKFDSVNINNASIDYISQNEFNNILSTDLLDNIFSLTKVLDISNGNINIKILDRFYDFSNINLQKKGSSNINIYGSFNYKDNSYQKDNKFFTFASSRYNGTDVINIKFNDFKIENSIVNEFFKIDNFSIVGSVNGEINLNFINALLTTIDIEIFSRDILLNIKNDINYKSLHLYKFPEVETLTLKAIYEYNENKFLINNLSIKIKNNNSNNSGIFINNELIINSMEMNTKLSFRNIELNNYLYIDSLQYDLNLLPNLSGDAELYFKKNVLNNIELSINDISNDTTNIKGINYNYKKNSKLNNLSFSVSTKYSVIERFLSKNDILNNIDSIPINSDDVVNFEANLSVSDLLNLKDTILGSINGNLIFSKNIKLYDDILILDSVKYKVDLGKFHNTISANINTNMTDINFKYFSDKVNKPNIKFDIILNDKILNNVKFIEYFDGDGHLACSLKYDNKIKYDCNIDLINTSFAIPFLQYKKNIKENALINFNGSFSNDLKFDDLDISYNNMENIIEAKLKVENINNNYFIKFNKFIYNKNNLKFGLNYNSGDFKIEIYSGNLDLSMFLKTSISNYFSSNLIVKASLEKLFIKDFVVDNATISYQNYEKKKSLNINGQYFSDENILFNYNNFINLDIFTYKFHASNAGSFFELLNYKSEIHGGILSSEGFIGNLDNGNDIMGTVSIDNFKIMKAPLFAELLLAASLTGLFEVLNNDGIEFEQFDAQFTGKNEIYNISKSRAYGFSIGLTSEGKINSKDKTINLLGSIIPAYRINSLLNNIPIVGDLLTAKEDEGIFAINYEAIGPWDEPNILINPLTLLTPGIIRNIFN